MKYFYRCAFPVPFPVEIEVDIPHVITYEDSLKKFEDKFNLKVVEQLRFLSIPPGQRVLKGSINVSSTDELDSIVKACERNLRSSLINFTAIRVFLILDKIMSLNLDTNFHFNQIIKNIHTIYTFDSKIDEDYELLVNKLESNADPEYLKSSSYDNQYFIYREPGDSEINRLVRIRGLSYSWGNIEQIAGKKAADADFNKLAKKLVPGIKFKLLEDRLFLLHTGAGNVRRL